MTTAVLLVLWFTPALLFVAAEAVEQQRRRRAAARLEQARAMPAEQLGDEPAVQAAEHIVWAAWTNTGQRWP